MALSLDPGEVAWGPKLPLTRSHTVEVGSLPDTPGPHPQAYNYFQTSGQPPNIFFPQTAQHSWLHPTSLCSSPSPLHGEILRYPLVSQESPRGKMLPSHLAHPNASPPALSVPAACPPTPQVTSVGASSSTPILGRRAF